MVKKIFNVPLLTFISWKVVPHRPPLLLVDSKDLFMYSWIDVDSNGLQRSLR